MNISILAHKIDEKGFMIFNESVILYEIGTDEVGNSIYNVPTNFVATPLPKDENGNQLPFYKPKWTGTEWTEGVTQAEIEEMTRVEPSSPTAEERIEALEEALLLMMMEG